MLLEFTAFYWKLGVGMDMRQKEGSWEITECTIKIVLRDMGEGHSL